MVDDDDSSGEFREVNPGNWKKNNNNKTPIPTYTPTTPWPTYSPTSLEDLAEWLKRKQKYIKNRDRVPDDVWEADEASVSKKKQLWLEKQKEKKNNKEEDGQSTEKHQVGTPTITPTYYDPPLVPTREQKRAKQAAKHQNRTQAEEAADDNLTPSPVPTLLNISNKTEASSSSASNIPTISDVGSDPQLPTRKQKQADKRAELAAQKKLGNTTKIETQEPTKSPTTMGREYDGSTSSTKTRDPPKSRGEEVNEDEENVHTTESSLKDTLEEHSNSTITESGRESVGSRSPPKSRNPPKSRSPSEKTPKVEKDDFEIKEDPDQSVMVSLKFPARGAPKPSPKPVEPRSSVKVNFTFINNRAKRKQPSTDAPTPSEVITSEPTYLIFPTIVPTEQHPTYAPTVEMRSRSRKSDRAQSLYDKRTCPDNHQFFESEFKEFQGAAEKNDDTVFFTYGIQTGTDTDIEDAVEKIQLWLLDDVASKLLHCSKSSTVMRNYNLGRNGQDGILSSVYYSKDDYQYAKQCNPTYPEATMCAIVSSTMRFEAADHDVNARPKVLSVIYNQLQSGYFMRLEEENILGLAYLGPELGYFQDDIEVNDTPTFNWSSPTSMYAAIGVASFTAFTLLLCLAMRYKLKKERRRRMQPVAAGLSYRDSPTHYRDSVHHDDFYSYTQSGSRRSYYRQNI